MVMPGVFDIQGALRRKAGIDKVSKEVADKAKSAPKVYTRKGATEWAKRELKKTSSSKKSTSSSKSKSSSSINQAEEERIQQEVTKELKSNVVNKPVTTRWVNVEYETGQPDGSFVTQTKSIQSKDISKFSKNPDVRITEIQSGKGTVFYDVPTTSEYDTAYKMKLRKRYTGKASDVPSSLMEQIVIPEEIKDLKMQDKYITETYEDYLGLNNPNQKESDLEQAYQQRLKEIPVDEALIFGKKYYKFGEDKITYEKLRSEEGKVTANIALFQAVGKDRKPSDIITTKEWTEVAGMIKQKYNYVIGDEKFGIIGIPVEKGGNPKIRGMIDTEAHAIATRGLGPLDVTSLSIYDYEQAHKNIAKQIISGGKWDERWFESLPLRTGIARTIHETTKSTAVFPITLAQTGIKLVNKGKTLALPDVSEYLAKHKVTPVQGAVGGVIGEGISRGTSLGKTGSGFIESAKKYPFYTGVATGAEVITLMGVGGSIGKIKGYSVRGLGKIRSGIVARTGWNVPTYTTFVKYSPVNIVRTGKWKLLEKMGKATEIKPEIAFNPTSLPNQLSYAPGSTSSQRINAMIKAFKKTKAKTVYGDELYHGIHATTDAWYKPIAWLRKGRESPGVSFAPFGKGAPRFLRIGGDATGSGSSGFGGISILPKIKLRTAPMLYFKKIIRIPKGLSNTYEKANAFIKKTGEGVYVAPKMYQKGGEYEVIARGFAKRLGARYFTRIEGVTIPLPEFTLTSLSPGKALLSGIKSSADDLFGVTSSYNAPSRVALFSPGYIGSKLSSSYSSSYKPYSSSYSSSLSSSLSSSIPSYTSSSIASYISSKGYSIGSSYGSKISSPSISTPNISSSSFKDSSYEISFSSSFSSYPSYSSNIYRYRGSDKKKSKRKRSKSYGDFYDFGYSYREYIVPRMKQFLKEGDIL